MLSYPAHVRTISAIAALVVALSICGQTSTSTALVTPNPSPSPTATPDPSHFVVANTTNSATMDGIALHLIGLDTSLSPPPPLPTLGATCGSFLVLTSASPTSTSSTKVREMRNYLANFPTGSGVPSPSPALQPPDGLTWIPASTTCSVRFEVSNVTSQGGQTGRDITITGLDLRLVSSPLPLSISAPTDPHARIDVCSVAGGEICSNLGLAPDDVYEAQVTLGSGGAGSTFPGAITLSGTEDPTLYTLPFILRPGQSRDIDVTITAPASSTALAYQVAPELQINDSSARTLAYSALQTNLTFAQPPAGAQQWPCYGFLANPDRIVPDTQVPYDPGNTHAYCF